MEYYILKKYKKRKQEEDAQGFDEFDSKVKGELIICLVFIIIGYSAMLVFMYKFPQDLWYMVGLVVCIIALFSLFYVDNKDQKEHVDKYMDLHKKKIEILKEILETELGINTKEKVEELLSIYQKSVDKKKEDEKRRNNLASFILNYSPQGSVHG